MRKEENNRNIWIKMIEAVCTGRLIILKKHAAMQNESLSEILVSNGENDELRERWSA